MLSLETLDETTMCQDYIKVVKIKSLVDNCFKTKFYSFLLWLAWHRDGSDSLEGEKCFIWTAVIDCSAPGDGGAPWWW